MVGTIEPRKNHHGLLSAFLDLGLDEKGYRLLFVGEESIRNSLYDKIKNGDTKKRVESALVRLINVTDYDLLNLTQAAKIAIYPSFAEGFGIPPLESAIMEVPTICSNFTSMEDFRFFKKNHIKPTTDNIKSRITAIINKEDSMDYAAVRNDIISTYNWSKSAETLMRALR